MSEPERVLPPTDPFEGSRMICRLKATTLTAKAEFAAAELATAPYASGWLERLA